jgi:mutual gliding-motility protein MglA
MVQINFALREVNCKIVYYGPGMSGKTTNLEIVHKKAPEANKGELTSIATEGDRTLFFDFMPLDLGTIAGMRTRFQLYTVPGQVYYNSTRKLVLQGVDGLVFVADSSASKMEENLESLENLKNNLAEYGKDIREIALVIQYNKRDLPDALSPEELNEKLNPWGCPSFEAVAITGEGVFPTLKCLSGLVLETLNRDERETPAPAAMSQTGSVPAAVGAAAPATAAAPAAPARAAAAGISTGFANVNGPAFNGGQASTFGQGVSGSQSGKMSASASQSGSMSSSTAGGALPPGPSWTPRKKIEATPLEANINATSSGSGGGSNPSALPRRVQINEPKEFPWALVAVGGLIIVAIAVILVTTGIVSLPF